jgi:hypothetical protein
VGQVHESVDCERRRSTVDHGHRLGGGSLENGRNGAPVRGTSPRLREKGEGTAVSPTGYKRGRRRVRNDRATVENNRRRRRSMGWTLRTRKRAIEGEVSVVTAGGAPHPFIVAGEGHTGAREGKWLAIIVLMPLMVGRLDEGLRGEIKAWSEDLAWHLEVGGRAAQGGRRRREEAAMVSRRGRKMKLIAQAHLTERRERSGQLGRREQKGKTYFHEDATDARARWAGKGGFGPREERGQQVQLGQRPRGP